MSVRAVVVGLGSIGQRHARTLRAQLGTELVLSAVRSRRLPVVVSDGLTAVAGDPGADCDGGVCSDLGEALAQGPDLVFICTPSSLHVPAAIAAVEAGAAVFVEKPVSDDLAAAESLRKVAQDRGAVVTVGFQLRYHPALRRLRQLVAERAVGRLLRVDAEVGEYLPGFHPYEDYRQSYAARRELGGGVILTQIHELDYLQWIFGPPQTVLAIGGRLGELEIDVEDTVSAICRHEIDERPVAVHVHLDFLQRPARRSCRVVGDRGVIEVDLRAPSLTWADNDGAIREHHDYEGFARPQLFNEQLAAFLRSARGAQPPEVDLDQAVTTMRTALALHRSMETGECQQLV